MIKIIIAVVFAAFGFWGGWYFKSKKATKTLELKEAFYEHVKDTLDKDLEKTRKALKTSKSENSMLRNQLEASKREECKCDSESKPKSKGNKKIKE